MLFDCAKQTEHDWQCPGRALLAVAHHAGVKPAAEVVDNRAVEIAAGVGQCGSCVLPFVNIQRRGPHTPCCRLAQQFLKLLGRHLQTTGQLWSQPWLWTTFSLTTFPAANG
jgi:hypothetical protein